MKRLAIILINYNGWKDTKECLQSLSAVDSDRVEIEVIVVDNGSETKIKSQLSKIKSMLKGLNITLIQNKQNLGFSGGNNTGIKYALEQGADYIMLLNNDTIVSSNFIDPLIDFFNLHENAGMIGPKIYFAKGYEYHKEKYSPSDTGRVIWYAGGIIDWDNVYASHRGVDEVDIGRYNQPVQTQFVSGCCMLIKREVIDKIGMLDEKYFMYLEDVDFCMRAVNAGYKLWYVPVSHIWHKNAQSSGDPGSDLHVYFQTRNRLLFGMKYAALRTKLALLKNSIHVIWKNGKRRNAVIDFYLGRFGKKENLHFLC